MSEDITSQITPATARYTDKRQPLRDCIMPTMSEGITSQIVRGTAEYIDRVHRYLIVLYLRCLKALENVLTQYNRYLLLLLAHLQ